MKKQNFLQKLIPSSKFKSDEDDSQFDKIPTSSSNKILKNMIPSSQFLDTYDEDSFAKILQQQPPAPKVESQHDQLVTVEKSSDEVLHPPRLRQHVSSLHKAKDFLIRCEVPTQIIIYNDAPLSEAIKIAKLPETDALALQETTRLEVILAYIETHVLVAEDIARVCNYLTTKCDRTKLTEMVENVVKENGLTGTGTFSQPVLTELSKDQVLKPVIKKALAVYNERNVYSKIAPYDQYFKEIDKNDVSPFEKTVLDGTYNPSNTK